ncbi:MAG TPA: PRC-barrel domain-containing protein [Reyranellaceae bacterium]|nr:PRC-barrel domain-containing protein [Reyranellaceae bacterium]
MLKPIAIAAALTTFGAAAVYAQTTTQPAPADRAPTVQTNQQQAEMSGNVTADTRKLIGRNVKNMQGETIGEIESIYVGGDGKIHSVIVGVGGFLGMGERHAQLAWKDLKIENGGERVTVNMTKDQLKAMAPYTYKEASYRGQIYTDRGLWQDNVAADRRADNRATTDRRANERPTTADNRAATERTAPAPATRTTKDWNAAGHVSGEAVLKASVRNTNNEKVGEIKDVFLDDKGQIQSVVVSVGGFLGMGSKHVEVKWNELQVKRDGNDLVVTGNWTKDSLKAMPEYKYEQAAAPMPAPTTTPAPAERKQ